MPTTTETPRTRKQLAAHRLLIGVGALSLVLGLIGLLIPLVPTTPFLLVSAACWSRASPRLHRWLLSRPHIGPMIQRWEEHRVVSVRVRVMAIIAIAISFGGSIYLFRDHAWLPYVLTAIAIGVTVLIIWMPGAQRSTKV